MNAIPLVFNAPKANINVNSVSPINANSIRTNNKLINATQGMNIGGAAGMLGGGGFSNEAQLRQEVNTSIVALKREAFSLENLIAQAAQTLQDINKRLSELEGKQGDYVKKNDVVDSITSGNMNPVTSNAVANSNAMPVNSVTSGNMHSVTSGAVYSELVDGDSWHYWNTETISGNMWYKIVGKTVFLRINITNNELSFPSSGGDMIYTASGNTVYLPSAIRPQRNMNFLLCDNFTDSAIHARLQTNGAIRAWSSPTTDIRNVSSWQCDYCYRLD